MKSKKKDVLLQFVKDEDVPFTMKLRSMDNKERAKSIRHSRVFDEDFENEDSSRAASTRYNSNIASRKSSFGDTKPPSSIACGKSSFSDVEPLSSIASRKSSSSDNEPLSSIVSRKSSFNNTEPFENIIPVKSSATRRKSKQLFNQRTSQSGRRISHFESDDSFDKSPVEKLRKSSVSEKSPPKTRRSNRLSSMSSRNEKSSSNKRLSSSPSKSKAKYVLRSSSTVPRTLDDGDTKQKVTRDTTSGKSSFSDVEPLSSIASRKSSSSDTESFSSIASREFSFSDTEPVKNVTSIKSSATRKKNKQLNQSTSQFDRKILYFESEDSFDESPVEKSRKSSIFEKSPPKTRRSSRLSSMSFRNEKSSPNKRFSSSPSKSKAKYVRKSTSTVSQTLDDCGAKQPLTDTTPIKETVSIWSTPKSSKFTCRQSRLSSSVPRRILPSPKLKSGSVSTNASPEKGSRISHDEESKSVRNSACATPTSKSKRIIIPKTPNTVRRRLANKLQTRVERIEFEDSDTSEYEESSDESETPSDSDEHETSESEAEKRTSRIKRLSPIREYSFEKKTIAHDVEDLFDYNFTLNADEYFISRSSKRPTSNNKLSTLEVPRIEGEELKETLSTSYTKHKLQLDSLILQYENDFRQWMFYLEEGFNLLMYGLGSKIELLIDFHKRMLHNYHVVTVHGYCPELTMKKILNSLLVDVLKEKKCPKDTNEVLTLINNITRIRKIRIFIIVHNIDGPVLRESKYQQILCKLASFSNIHMIASIDHINAPLLWGNSKMCQFNFVWLPVTTYKPYINETSFGDALNLTKSDSDYVSLSSLREIFKPLVQKVKKIFRIIAKERLDNKDNKNYKGISLTDWYRKARSEFLVNNKNIFRVMLTELVDHKIIKLNNEDCIPLKIKLHDLEIFYEQQFGEEN